VQQLLPLRGQHLSEDVESGHVACWAAEVGDEAKVDRIGAGYEHDRNSGGRRLSGERCWRPEGGDDDDLTINQIGGQAGQPFVFALRPTVFDRHVSSLDEAKFLQAFLESGH
jgi:hypothetical protein